KMPKWEGRDRLYLSNGHICPVRYAAMARAGYFPVKRLLTCRKLGSPLQGHPSLHDFPAVESSSGPLGQGLSVAVGAALAARMDNKKWYTWCVTSDGEHDEGETWEAIMLAAKERLGNLTNIIDRNHIQLSGPTKEIMPMEPLADKYKAFGWQVFEVDGNKIEKVVEALKKAKAYKNRPTVVIAHTTLGKGVSFMENNHEWHGKAPDKEQAKKAIKELRK
ncbi:transketolase, partial [Candidatus Woesearchaeota archaeon]|nr:transketolase [Candidatus Woesearchaeota archaeon]